MRADEYIRFDAVGLAERIANREVSPAEVLEAAISQTERVDPSINAVVHKLYDVARHSAASEAVPGPFAGVPFLVKDMKGFVEGAPSTDGARLLKDFVAASDNELVSRYRRAGLTIFGKTNSPEFGLNFATESLLLGPCRNPWDPDRTPGGSSGGAAAAVAARIVPMAHAGDGGGSIRVPASCCGLFGLKVSRGLMPTGPRRGAPWEGAAVAHAITRTVRDSAALLDATWGSDPGAPYAAPGPSGRGFRAALDTPPPRLRIALARLPIKDVPVHADCGDAVMSAGSLCVALGHDVVEAQLPVRYEDYAPAYYLMVACQTAADVAEAERLVGQRAGPDNLEAATWGLVELGRRTSAEQYIAAVRTLELVTRQVAQFFTGFDLLLTPTLAQPPVRVGALDQNGTLDPIEHLDRVFTFGPFTNLFNVTGRPAMNVPLYWNAQALPIGTQFVGRLGADQTLLQLARQLEEARPWEDRMPPLVG